MARAACKTNGLQKLEGDDIEKSLEVLDKVLLEFEDPDSLPHIEPESPSQGNQSEDDGYMSMNGRRAKTSDSHQPSDESSVSPPVTDTLNANNSGVGETKPLSPPPPEVAEAIISNLLPRASASVTTLTIGSILNTEDCEKLNNERNRQTQENQNDSANIKTLAFVSNCNNVSSDVQDTGGGGVGGGRHVVGAGCIPESSTIPLQTTLPKARPSTVMPSKYSSLPCSGPPKVSAESFIRGMSRDSFDDGRNVLGIGISAVHDAVLRGSVVRLPEPIVNEHPVTIYPGRASPPRSRVPPRTLPGSIERHREVCRNIISTESGADNVDSRLPSPLKRLVVSKSPSSPLVSVQQHFLRNIKSSHQLVDNKNQSHLNNLLIIPRRQNGEHHRDSSDSEDFSDDSLEGQSLPPPPPPPVVPPPPSLSAPVTPSKRGSIAWEINLDDHLPPPPPLQQHQTAPLSKKKSKGKSAPVENSSSSAKVIPRRRGRSMSGSQSSLASTPGNSIGSVSNRYSPQYPQSNKSGSMEWPEPPDPPVCSTEDEAASIYSDSDEIIPNYPSNLTGKGTYVIRKGRRERHRLADLNASMSSSINSRLSSEGNLSGIVHNNSLFVPNSRHSIDLGSHSHNPMAVHNQMLSPRSRLSLDLSSPNSTSEHPQTTVIPNTSNGVLVPQQSLNSSPHFQELKSFNTSYDTLQIYESNGNDGIASGNHSSTSSLNNNNGMNGSLTRVSSLPCMPPPSAQNETITTPRRELAPPLEEDEEQDSESQRGAPLRQIENNISALLRGDIAVARVGDLSLHRRPLGFRPGVHKSESAKEMLLSQSNALGPLPPSPPCSSPEPENDGFPPLPPSPQENIADDEEGIENDILRGIQGLRISSRTRLKNELSFSRDLVEHPPAVPPHRIQPSLNTLKTRSMDAGYTKKYSSTSPHSTGPGTLPGELPGNSSRRRLMSGAFPKRSAQSPREEKRLQTSCSLPETPIFARGCDIPRTPHRRAPEVPPGGSRTAPRTNTTSSLGSSIVGIGSTLGGGRQRNISQALASGEMLRLAGGPARGWYPKQRNMRPASTEHLDRLHRSQASMRAWDSGGGISGPGGSRKPLTLPPNLTPKFFNKSPREALRRVTSLLIRKGNSKEKEPKREKDPFVASAVHRSPGSAGDIPVGQGVTEAHQSTNHQQKKKGFFKSFWKKSKHFSLDHVGNSSVVEILAADILSGAHPACEVGEKASQLEEFSADDAKWTLTGFYGFCRWRVLEHISSPHSSRRLSDFHAGFSREMVLSHFQAKLQQLPDFCEPLIG